MEFLRLNDFLFFYFSGQFVSQKILSPNLFEFLDKRNLLRDKKKHFTNSSHFSFFAVRKTAIYLLGLKHSGLAADILRP
jgi:hypothetical protein